MKQTIKSTIPVPAWNLLRETYQTFRRLPQLPAAFMHPWRRESIQRLTTLKDAHKGQRAFVIANGPSLKQTDLSKLRNEVTLGMNRIYLMFPEIGFSTNYLSVVNDLVIEQTASDLAALMMPKFLSWRSRRFFPSNLPMTQLPTFLYTTYESPSFSTDVRGRVWEGATVTNVTLQLAFHMETQHHCYITRRRPESFLIRLFWQRIPLATARPGNFRDWLCHGT